MEPDYLVIGAGANAMSFVDSLLSESKSSVLLVDRRDHPGGHWNDAYPFATLHAPSLFYGVPSTPLGSDQIEKEGFNAGHRVLASKAHILSYYERVMRERFLPSRRVHWLPRHECAANGLAITLHSLVDGSTREVSVKKRVVDATRSNVRIPANHRPPYDVAAGINLITPTDLVDRVSFPPHFCVIGAGKTAMDTCVWLLEHNVDADRVTWVKPRESLVLDREITRNFDSLVQSIVAQLAAVASAANFKDFLQRAESWGMTQIDMGTPATQFRGAMLSQREISLLRRIKKVVRFGHLRSIEPLRLVLQCGNVSSTPETLYIDCTAYGHNELPNVPTFESGRINLQQIRAGEPLFSAAFIAYVESALHEDELKNALCRPVPLPSKPSDLLRTAMVTFMNLGEWAKYPQAMSWAARCPLGMLPSLDMKRASDPADPGMTAIASMAERALPCLTELLADADSNNHFDSSATPPC